MIVRLPDENLWKNIAEPFYYTINFQLPKQSQLLIQLLVIGVRFAQGQFLILVGLWLQLIAVSTDLLGYVHSI